MKEERPDLAVKSDKDRVYKAGRLKSRGAGREPERFVLCASSALLRRVEVPLALEMRSAISERACNASRTEKVED